MKILRIIARLNVGGPARHVTLLDAGLTARGHATRLAFGALDTGEASLEGPALASGIPVERIADLGRSVRAGSDARAFLALLRLVFREQPDVVHTHTAKAGTLGRLAALVYNITRPRSRRALVVHTFHGHVFEGYFSERVNRLVRLTERWLARITNIVVTISPRQRDDIVQRFRIAEAAKTVVVPLGLNLDALLSMKSTRQAGQTSGRADAALVIGYIGRMVPVKDLPTLIRAFGEARAADPRLQLVLAGDGPERPAAEALAAQLGLTPHVTFPGWVHDLPAFYAGIDLFALSSINEGTPVAVIEAMAAALPVVATAVGGVPDVVTHEVDGILVPPGDVSAMAAAFASIAASPERRTRFGAAGREQVRRRYSHTRLVEEIEALYVKGLTHARGR